MKDIVYSTEVNSRNEVIDRIQAASRQIRDNFEILLKVQPSIPRRYRKCVENGGSHFENVL